MTVKNNNLTLILGSLAALAPTNEIRYYLNGVLVECDKDGNKYMVITNGHYMVFTELRGELADCVSIERNTRAILDVNQLKAMLKAIGKNAVSLTVNNESNVTINQDSGLDGTINCIDGRFPDWRRVNNPIEKAEFTALNADYLVKLMREFKKHSSKKAGFGVMVETADANHASRFTHHVSRWMLKNTRSRLY